MSSIEQLQRQIQIAQRNAGEAVVINDLKRQGLIDSGPATATPSRTSMQLLVVTTLLEKAIEVVRNVEAEGSSEAELLQALIEQSEAAIEAVLLEYLRHG